jgi:hypothetical protein
VIQVPEALLKINPSPFLFSVKNKSVPFFQRKLLAWDEVICEVTLLFRKVRARHITSCHAIDFGRGDTPSNRCSLVELQSPLMTLLAIQDAVPILRESDRAIA